MKIVAVYSTKGGVGKTTAAVNLAWEASQDFRVLLWDLDPQGAATYLLQVKPKLKGGAEALVDGTTRVRAAIRSTTFDRLDLLPADASYRELDVVLDHAKDSTGRIRRVLERVADDYDVVILDCPPGAGLVAENAVLAADLVVVPLVPSPLSLRSLEQVVDFVASSPTRSPILGFLSMVDRRKAVHRNAVVQLPRAHESVSNIVVPNTVVIERMGSERAPVGLYAPQSEAAHAYSELWVRIQSTVKARRRKSKH
ncbi:cobyrinic acid a,c-diamide synthase [Subtercola boreus]|uniref:Cobyrinic acid a,c-diamide synthase n=1 Tax=Subtercola boreus TaxID=120213 RepID=A0A3E0VSK9_9MICO|nr:ParA family protein [Subtercola boreus]RFA12363.1 cobyrinic acid a,c-diamide synthase [Subtercola boreus]